MLFLASVLPALVNIVPNALIFTYVRSSTNRIQPQVSNTMTNSVTVHHSKISRREIALVKQMTYMFVVLTLGWSPIYVITVIISYTPVDLFIYHLAYVLCQISVISIVLNLFKINGDLRQYLWNKIRFFCTK